MAKLKGTVFERPNGTFTALTEPIWDPKRNRTTRPSLGTYRTKTEAEKAQIDYNSSGMDDVFGLTEIEQRQVRIDVYMAEWHELLERERDGKEIALATQRDYETVARLHIIPRFGVPLKGALPSSDQVRMI